jgi:hypothetical protein
MREGRLRAAGAPVGADGGGGGEGGGRLDLAGGDHVGARQEARVVERRDGGAVDEGGPQRVDDAAAQPGDAAVPAEGQLPLGDGPAPVVGGLEVLAPARHPLDRPPEPHRQVRDQDVLAVGRRLHPEAAAHLGGDGPHARLRDAEGPRDLGPHREGCLGRAPHRQLLGAGVEGGEDDPRLQGHRRDALLDHPQPDDPVGAGEGRRRVAVAPDLAERPVGPEVGEQDRRAGGEGRFRVHHRRPRLVLDLDQVRRVARRRRALGGDGRHRGRRRAHHVVGEHRVRRHPHVGEQPHDRHRAQVTHVGAGDDRGHPGGGPGAGGVEPDDAGVGVRAAEEGHVEQARRLEVVHEAAGADQEPAILDALPGAPDPAAVARLRHRPRLIARGRARRPPGARPEPYRSALTCGSCPSPYPRSRPKRRPTSAQASQSAASLRRTRSSDANSSPFEFSPKPRRRFQLALVDPGQVGHVQPAPSGGRVPPSVASQARTARAKSANFAGPVRSCSVTRSGSMRR